ncbi:hypothetical protein D3C77_88450 [compost metagenome]
MKKTILMSLVIGCVGFAGVASAADQASATFTWSGSVPMAPISDGFIIKDSAGNDIERGTMVFNVDAAGKGSLASASTLDFNVYAYDGTTVGAPADSYDFRLISLEASKNGLPQEQDANGYYAIMADDAEMVKGATATVKAAGGVTNLTVVPATGVSTPSNQPLAGEAVDIHARIVISNAL